MHAHTHTQTPNQTESPSQEEGGGVSLSLLFLAFPADRGDQNLRQLTECFARAELMRRSQFCFVPFLLVHKYLAGGAIVKIIKSEIELQWLK